MKILSQIVQVSEFIIILFIFIFMIIILLESWNKIKIEQEKNLKRNNDKKEQKKYDEELLTLLKQEEKKYINGFLKTKKKSIIRINNIKNIIQDARNLK